MKVVVRGDSLRIAIVSDAILGRNGVGTYYPDLVQHLEPLVDHIQLFGPREARDRTLEAFSLPMPGDATQRMAYPWKASLYDALDACRPNIIVIPSLGAFSYYALQYAKRRRLPIAVVNHTSFDRLLSLYFPSLLVWPLERVLSSINRWLIGHANAVAVLDADAFKNSHAAGAKTIRVVGTPLNHDFFRRPIQPVSQQITSAVFIGRLAKEKRLDRILSAARDLPDIRFSIIGDGPLRGEVERTSGRCSNLQYTGWVSRDEVLAQIDESQLLVLPSELETFGTVALEALARQRYVLTSPDCGITKWPSLAQGLFATQPDESLQDAIRRLCALSHEQRRVFAEPSWQAVRAFNDYTIHVWLKFLSDAAGLRDRGPSEPFEHSRLDVAPTVADS